ncbi:MAG: MerR family transcriptional regulator [Lachnospiraceae bacterium]|nr:MerR family transcriptional regulator [Lachnospiraceae bacterium]
MKYKISEVSKMTGIPVDTIRYYETAGIVKPTRVNTYRYYSEIDVLNLLEYRKMRNYGMNMSEIKDFFQITDMEQYAREFERLEEKYAQAVRYYQALHKYAQQSVHTIREAAQGMGQYRLVTMPEKYYIHFYFHEEEGDEEESDIWQCWINEYYSLVEYLAIFKQENFILDVPKNECLWVNALDKKVVEELQIPLPTHVDVIPAHKAVYTVVEETGEDFYDLDVIDGVKQYLNAHQYQVAGDIIGKMISRIQDHGVERRYLGIWIPIES